MGFRKIKKSSGIGLVSQEAALHPGVSADIQIFNGLASLHAEKLALTSQLLVCPHYTAE